LQAFGNLLRRMLEASGRGIWNADGDMLEKLKSMYGDLDDQLEGVWTDSGISMLGWIDASYPTGASE
jgi:magnesium chelatase subunit H